ncbi:glycosyltransferase [Methylobacterium sp. E-005]|uniref:glycosyltransferase n=1 Tax=Methylobacterium sp. E-005 TaxID=2836549 RepID=UPI001FB99233|nr:glycosyltransferase [Methylobacterium sp. E-005]MCJ2088833.1 glycosyltransferase [Methylobacterium sp. E-005]
MRNRDVKLKLFSAIDGLSQNRIEYSNFLYMLRDQLGLREEIDLQFGFKPMSEILSAVRESNVALFCYADLTEGGSSAVRIPLSCGVPTITSFSSIFSDLANICHQIDTQDAARAADLIEELVLDPDKMETAILKQTSYLDFSTWSKHFSRLDRMTDASSDRTKSGPHSYLEKVLSHH